MAGFYCVIVSLIVLPSVVACSYGQSETPEQPVTQTDFIPCRSGRTTKCPPGFLCCEVSDGISKCLPTKEEQKCFRVGFGRLYKGFQTKTVKGRTCQRWDSETPHRPRYIYAKNFPDNSITEANNYCRDPRNYGRPWCYTTDPSEEWDYCDLPPCSNEDCYKIGFPKLYQGRQSVTPRGNTCQRWDKQTPHKHSYTDPNNFPDVSLYWAENYCRLPRNSRSSRPFCYTTNSKKRYEYCDIEPCKFDFCCDDKAWKFQGQISVTRTGIECRRWDEGNHKFRNMPKKFPEESVSAAENYCRDPSWNGRPWCYTNDPSQKWDYCAVKKCSSAGNVNYT